MSISIEVIKGIGALYNDNSTIIKVYQLRSPRYIFWNHYDVIAEISNHTFIRIYYESDGFKVEVY